MTISPDKSREGPRGLALLQVLILFAVAACAEPGQPDNNLQPLGADGGLTVSGISSGGYMAGQFLVAYSSDVDGAGLVATGPWGCAKGDITRALQTCISGAGLETDELHELATSKAQAGDIDPLSGLNDARVFLFRGKSDAVVGAAAMNSLQAWFLEYGKASNTVSVDDVDVVHGWPTESFGNACGTFDAPYINNCGYDLAGEILSHFYPDIDPPTATPGELQQFDQSAFGEAGLADNGYLYVPEACERSGGCKLHVFFHGCEQSADSIGTTLVENAGLNRWAESNGIVVLYPQVAKSLAAPMNPLGCWDWWGYTGESYLGKDGPQLAAVRSMVDVLAGN